MHGFSCAYSFIVKLIIVLASLSRLDLIGSISLLTVITNVYAQNLVIARTGKYVKAMTRLSKSIQATPLTSMFPVAYILKVIT